MTGNLYHSVHADRLHISALIGERLTVLHTRPEIEIVVHVFDIRAEQTGEAFTAANHAKEGVTYIAGDIVFADAQPAADAVVETIEIYLRRSCCCDQCTKYQ